MREDGTDVVDVCSSALQKPAMLERIAINAARYFDLNFTAEAIARRMLRHIGTGRFGATGASETASRRSAAASICARAPSSAWWQSRGARAQGLMPMADGGFEFQLVPKQTVVIIL